MAGTGPHSRRNVAVVMASEPWPALNWKNEALMMFRSVTSGGLTAAEVRECIDVPAKIREEWGRIPEGTGLRKHLGRMVREREQCLGEFNQLLAMWEKTGSGAAAPRVLREAVDARESEMAEPEAMIQ